MKQILLILYGCLCCLSAVGQPRFFPEIGQRPLREYAALERALHSVRLPDNTANHFAGGLASGPGQCYQRPAAGAPPRPMVKYYYSLPDSVVRHIEVNIDSSLYLSTTAREAYREPLDRYAHFETLYQQLLTELTVRLGEPVSGQSAQKMNTLLGEVYAQQDYWKKRKLTANLMMVFTIAPKAPVGNTLAPAQPAYRIQASIDYNIPTGPGKPQFVPTLNPQQTDVAKRFVSLLLAGQYAECWKLTGPDMQQSLSEFTETFTAFHARLVAPEKGATLYMSIPSVTSTGQEYASYAFRLNSDEANPPALLFTILFKDLKTALVSGIQTSTTVIIPVR